FRQARIAGHRPLRSDDAHIRNRIVTWAPLICCSVPSCIKVLMHPWAKRGSAGLPKRAILRLALGQIQVAGSTASLILLIGGGVCRPAIWAVTLTGLVSLISVLIFQVIWRGKTED